MVRSLQFSVALVPARRFFDFGALVPFEELRDRHELCFFDAVDPLMALEYKVVFFSHQWSAWDEPDPTGRQYQVMCAALRHVVACYGWSTDETFVWVE